MRRSIARRAGNLLLVLLGASLLTFFLAYLAPSDPAQIMLNQMGVAPSPEALAKTRASWGLDTPIPLQYVRWLAHILRGDFGTSYKYDMPVVKVILMKLPATLELAGISILLMIVLAFPVGVASAVYKNKASDYILRLLSMLSISMPTFWLALLLMYLFSFRLKVLPVICGGSFRGILMPAFTLAFSMAGKYARQLRAAILEETRKEYVLAAIARGIRRRRIVIFGILPNIVVPIVTMLGLSIGGLLGGAAIVESVFAWPGVGEMALDAILNRDYPLIQGYVIWMAIIYVAANSLVNLINAAYSGRKRA